MIKPIVIFFFVVCVVAYSTAAFILANLDPFKWAMRDRAGLAFFVLSSTILFSLNWIGRQDKKEGDEQ
jgi:hypothetical protein